MTDRAFQEHVRAVHDCRRCLEAGFSITPGPIFSGPQSARTMIVGQAPGRQEVGTGLPFSGPAGRQLFVWLEQAGFDGDLFRGNQYITAITRCYPGKGSSRGDRVPTAAERSLCEPFLAREIELVQPEVIIPVGGVAIRRFLDKVRLDDAVGQVYKKDGKLLLPLPHPSGANIWLNRSTSKRLLKKALAALGEIRKQMNL